MEQGKKCNSTGTPSKEVSRCCSLISSPSSNFFEAYSIILSLLASTHTSISPGLQEYAFGYIKAFPCPFRMQHLIPSSLSIAKSLLATAFTFMFCLRICCAFPIQFITSSLPIGFCFNSSGYSFPSLSIPSRQSPSRACLEAKEYHSCQSIPAITILISSLLPRQYFRKAKIAVISFIQLFISILNYKYHSTN